jgi:hypothetical protein
MTHRSLEALEFQLDLLKLSGLARQTPHPEAKAIANLAGTCRVELKQSAANTVQNRG